MSKERFSVNIIFSFTGQPRIKRGRGPNQMRGCAEEREAAPGQAGSGGGQRPAASAHVKPGVRAIVSQ